LPTRQISIVAAGSASPNDAEIQDVSTSAKRIRLDGQSREALLPARPVPAPVAQPIALPARRTLRLLAPVEYWHLLSLDAPAVAALWAWSFASIFRITLTLDSLLLLFAGTWLIYVSDRILDGFHQDSARLRERHFFYMRHRAAAILAAVPVAAFLAWLVFAHMTSSARLADVLIFSVALAYFCLVHLRGAGIERWFPKELVVALVFAAATTVPAGARLAENLAQKEELVLMAAIFAALCWLNCIAIEKWERTPRCASHIDPVTDWGQKHLLPLSAGTVIAAIFAGALFLHFGLVPASVLCFAAGFSAALFVALDRSQSNSRISAFHLRIAADAALLTPLALLLGSQARLLLR
jgi:hypothetical protein